MSGRGLLSRIAGNSAGHEVDSIVAHLRVLLGTCRGDAPAAPGFGLSSFVDMAHDLPDAAHDLAGSIRAAILDYEPRLTNVSVRHVPDDGLVLRFEIMGQLAGRERPVKLATTFRPGGRVDVGG